MVRKLWRLLFLCAVVGLIAGLGAITFYMLLDVGRWFFLEYLVGYHPASPGGESPLIAAPLNELRRWLFLLVPAAGGLLSGVLVYSLAPEAEGHGTDAAIDAYHNKAGKVRARVPLVKAIASALTIGSGGSGGREGPIAQIGSGFGSMLATWLHLKPHERRVLMAAGMGAGIGAIFHAPLAGALFSAEVLYSELDQEYEVIIPSVVASIVAYGVFAAKFGWRPLFTNPGLSFNNPAELLPYFALALVVSVGAIAYIKTFYGTRDLFRKIRIPNHVKPMIGGIGVGLIGYLLPEAIGTGYGFAQQALFGNVGIGILFAVGAAKILSTSLTIGTGGSGGVFGPAIVIGAALGGGTGLLMSSVFPGMNLQPGAFAIVGMAGFFAGAANTPISTIIMVSEMTGNYNLLVPAMWVCFLAYIFCKRYTIYEMQILSRFDAPVHITDMMQAVLQRIPIDIALAGRPFKKLTTVRESTDLHELAELFSHSEYSSFPILDQDGRAVSMVSGRELRTIIRGEELSHLIVASDLAHPLVKIAATDNLHEAVKLMADTGEDEICVVDPHDRDKVVALLSRNDIISAYHQALVSDRSGENADQQPPESVNLEEPPTD